MRYAEGLVTHAQTWASYSTLYRFGRLSDMIGPMVNAIIQSTVIVFDVRFVLKFFNIIQLITYPLTSLILRYALVMQ